MTWTKLGAEWFDESADLSDAAYRLHTEALGYSNRRLLDLVIQKGHLHRFAGTSTADTGVQELVQGGWWADRGESWWIGCRFPEWQRDRVQVIHRREQLAESQRRARRHKLGDHTLCLGNCRLKTASSDDAADDSTVESPPDPERNGTEQNSSEGRTKNLELRTKNTPSSADADGAFDDFWQSYPRKIKKLDARKAWTRATRRTSPDVIMAGLLRHLPIFAGQEPRFVPHATTWLNAERWDDVTPAQAPDPPLPSFWNDVTRPRLVGEQT